MRETVPSPVVECRQMNDCPRSDMTAPRAKSGWPPEDDQCGLPSDSEAHWPRKSTSGVALVAMKRASRATMLGSFG